MAPHLVAIVVVGAVVLWSVYRRFRRTIGRQPVRERSMSIRIAILAVVCVLLLLPPFFTLKTVGAAALGALVGLGLGLYAVMQTLFEITPEGNFYTPHLYLGLGVSALFIGRLVYRLGMTWPAMSGAAGQQPHEQAVQMAAYQHNPLTVGLFFLLAGYYICYYVCIIRRTRSLQQGADTRAE